MQQPRKPSGTSQGGQWASSARPADSSSYDLKLPEKELVEPVETLTNKGVVSVRAWTSAYVDPKAHQQALDTTKADSVVLPVALMPDAHVGIGACVGSVVATEGAIIPSTVGVDIGCGMSAVQTDLVASQLPDNLRGVLDAFRQAVPTMQHEGRKSKGTNKARAASLKWLERNPIPSNREHMAKAALQMGSLGGGNHFLELSLDNKDRVWIVLHSGSRGVGNILARGHIKLAAQLDKSAPNRDLAALKEGSSEFNAYRADMLWAQDYAYYNREAMLGAAVEAFCKAAGLTGGLGNIQQTIRCHHNYATVETHDGRDVWVTRKGAIRAQKGDMGIIPGSMGTSTFIVEGLGNPDSYNSAAHGAGRTMSRKQAKQLITEEDLREMMEGRVWMDGKANSLRDEAPQAYKDIHEVMEAQNSLCTAVEELTAIVNYKGTK